MKKNTAYTGIFLNVSIGKSLRNMQRQLGMSYIVTMLNNIKKKSIWYIISVIKSCQGKSCVVPINEKFVIGRSLDVITGIVFTLTN